MLVFLSAFRISLLQGLFLQFLDAAGSYAEMTEPRGPCCTYTARISISFVVGGEFGDGRVLVRNGLRGRNQRGGDPVAGSNSATFFLCGTRFQRSIRPKLPHQQRTTKHPRRPLAPLVAVRLLVGPWKTSGGCIPTVTSSSTSSSSSSSSI